MGRELLFSVSIKDCKVDVMRSSKGAGGQHRDKTSSAIRVTHPPSGAVGFSQEYREQPRNRREAFLRMLKTKQYRNWHRIMVAELMSGESIDELVEKQMSPDSIKVEHRDEKGKWVSS